MQFDTLEYPTALNPKLKCSICRFANTLQQPFGRFEPQVSQSNRECKAQSEETDNNGDLGEYQEHRICRKLYSYLYRFWNMH